MRVQFRSTRDLKNVELVAKEKLGRYVTIEPASFAKVSADQVIDVNLVISAPSHLREKQVNGKVNVIVGKKGIPHDLKLEIQLSPEETMEDEDEVFSPATLVLEGTSPETFNPIGADVRFHLEGSTFGEAVAVFHNGVPIPPESFTREPATITVSNLLSEGRNDLIFVGQDIQGRTIYHDFVVWAGNGHLTGRVLDEQGSPLPNVALTARLGDDQTVFAFVLSADGTFVLDHLPNRTILLEAITLDNRQANAAVVGNQGSVELRLVGFNPPSPINNNDFSLGVAGWNIGGSFVTLVPHVEGSSTGGGGSVLASPANVDLVLATSGEGPQTISRTFPTQAGTRNVTVRYRFITSEVPGGYFGSEYNDYFNISIRSERAGGGISEGHSMNGLGLAAFDSNGATDWREASLQLSEDGDTIQVDVTVANVADGLFDSQVVVDLITETELAITAMSLRDIDNTSLTHLSAAAHTYFSGNTRVHGTVTIEGGEADELASLTLEVIQGGGVVAVADLASEAQNTLLQPFGSDKKVVLSTSQLLFNLSSAQAAAVDSASDGTLSLRARARSVMGGEVVRELGAVQILARYTGTSRYGQRDGSVGGDDWARPSMIELVDNYSGLTWGDFSNMNGGSFPPHASHNNGLDADGWFSGYNERNAGTAATIIGHLNAASGSDIVAVFVTYQKTATDAFWTAIKDVSLNDGRRARDVILPVGGHTTHYHWRKL